LVPSAGEHFQTLTTIFAGGAGREKKARGYPVTPFDPNRIHAE
jgi:hypothetical protein